MRVVVVHDEILPDAPPDQQDSLVQVEAVSAALRDLGHDVQSRTFGLDLADVAERLRRVEPDLIFNLVESVDGKSRLLHLAPALFDSLGIPYTGGSTEALFLTTGKIVAKRMLRWQGLPTADWVSQDSERVADGRRFTPGRYIIKSVWEEASIGLSDACVFDATDFDSLRDAIELHSVDQGGEAFAERYIEGREFNLSVLGSPKGGETLPPAEMLFVDYPADKPKIVNYAAKWDESAFEYNHTPRRFDLPPNDGPLVRRLIEIAQSCWTLFGVRGYARVDFRTDTAGNPWILELNVNPCISPDGGFMAAAGVAGFSYRDVVERILADVRMSGSSGGMSAVGASSSLRRGWGTNR